MAIKTKEWKHTNFTSIKVNKKNKQKYLFDYTSEETGKRHRKVIVLQESEGLYVSFLEWKNKLVLETLNANATVKEYFELSQRLSDRSEGTKTAYERYFKNYISPISKMKITKVKSSHIDQLKLDTKHLSKSYQKKMFEILIPLFELSVDDDIITKTPIKKRQVTKRRQMEEMKVVTNAVEKYKIIHRTIHKEFEDNPRIRSLFLFGFYGRRKSEVLQLKWSDIHGDKYTVRGSISKVSADMTFDMHDDLRRALKLCMNLSDTYVYENSRTGEPISEIREYVARVRKKSGIGEFNFHWMRNLSVSALSAMGVDSVHLSGMLGHLDSGTLSKYLSLQRGEASRTTNAASEKLLHG